MNNKGNTNLHRRRNIFITLVVLTVLLIILAIKVYSASSLFGVNEASNEDTLTRLVAALAKAQYADRLVTTDNVSTKLYNYVTNSDATVAEDNAADVIIVTYTASGRKYYINKNTAYTIIFDANGGQNAPSPQTQGYGEKITLTTNQPTREGYVFLGWSTSYNSEEPQYEAGATYTGKGNVTLYAVWRLKTYTIAYEPTGVTGAPAAQTKYHGQDLTLSLKVPTKTGYTFQGWDESSAATTVLYSAGGTFTKDADTTLYPVMRANTYIITYNANGGTGAPAQQTYTYAESGTISLSTTKPTYSGYVFLGWSESSSATTASYASGGEWNRSVASNTTLYAVWKLDKYTVSYNANGGSGTVQSQTADTGASITLRANGFTAPSGKHFSNWNTNSGGTGTSYAAGATYSGTSDVTLYANWGAHTSSCYTSEDFYERTGGSDIETCSSCGGTYQDHDWTCSVCGKTTTTTTTCGCSAHPETSASCWHSILSCGGTE